MIPSRWKVTLLFLQNENHENKRNILTQAFSERQDKDKIALLVTEPPHANSDPLQSPLVYIP